jgi:putative FmdB family regulatory protein
MPIYEYYCGECHGIFEQLLPASRASESQPCPVCDSDSRRLMPTSFQSFIVRDGSPRRIPDRGKFWHHEQEVGRPVTQEVELGEHPDLIEAKFGPDQPPTIEEQEKFADMMVTRLEYEAESVSSGNLPSVDQYQKRQVQEFFERRAATAERAAEARRKRTNREVTPRTRTGLHRRTPSSPGGATADGGTSGEPSGSA